MIVATVDCLFMDVEGYERKVLDGIDFEKVRIDWIVAENSANDANQIRAVLADLGYQLRLRLPNDDVFRRVGFESGSFELNVPENDSGPVTP